MEEAPEWRFWGIFRDFGMKSMPWSFVGFVSRGVLDFME